MHSVSSMCKKSFLSRSSASSMCQQRWAPPPHYPAHEGLLTPRRGVRRGPGPDRVPPRSHSIIWRSAAMRTLPPQPSVRPCRPRGGHSSEVGGQVVALEGIPRD
eukprot:9043269-Pyramimonas_sp.AAC.1